jgi:hypothetical protein
LAIAEQVLRQRISERHDLLRRVGLTAEADDPNPAGVAQPVMPGSNFLHAQLMLADVVEDL